MIAKPFEIQPADTFEPSKRGAWAGVPAEIYHAAPGESNSLLALLEKSPARYRLTRDGKLKRKATPAMELGTAIHSVVNEGRPLRYHLRPETYGPEGKKWTMVAKECKAWVAAHADLPIFTEEDIRVIDSLAVLVRQTPFAMRLLAGAQTEVSACAYNPDKEFPFLLRVRFDILGKDSQGWYFVDTKSCIDASTDAVSREIYRRKYHAQFDLYKRVLEALTGEPCRAYIMALEKDPEVPRCNVRQISRTILEDGASVNDERFRLLKRCRYANFWPTLPDDEGGDVIQFIEPPEWARSDEIEISPTNTDES